MILKCRGPIDPQSQPLTDAVAPPFHSHRYANLGALRLPFFLLLEVKSECFGFVTKQVDFKIIPRQHVPSGDHLVERREIKAIYRFYAQIGTKPLTSKQSDHQTG